MPWCKGRKTPLSITASELGKPIVFHNRDADEDMIKILKQFPNVTGVAHCFSSNLETARAFLSFGFYCPKC